VRFGTGHVCAGSRKHDSCAVRILTAGALAAVEVDGIGSSEINFDGICHSVLEYKVSYRTGDCQHLCASLHPQVMEAVRHHHPLAHPSSYSVVDHSAHVWHQVIKMARSSCFFAPTS
jgi:hypothetical protein